MTSHSRQNGFTSGRAIEFAEYYHSDGAFPDRANPISHDDWGKEILRIFAGSDGSVLGDIAFFDPMRKVFADYTQDKDAQKLITDHFVARFQSPMYRNLFTLDDQLNLLIPGDDGFAKARTENSNNPEIAAKRAQDYLEKQCDALSNICYDIYQAFDQKAPGGEQLRNIRMSINTETNEMQVRLANPLEKIADATLGRIRDARSGSLTHDDQTIFAGDTHQKNALDRLAVWFVNQPVLRPLATQIAENYSSFMMPDEDQNHSTILKQWRERKNRASLERTLKQ